MKSIKIGLMLFLILLIGLTIYVACELHSAEQKLLIAEQELSIVQNEANILSESLQIETDKNKSMELVVSDLNVELSIANEKITNMQNMGIPVYFTDEEVAYIAKTVLGEAGASSKIQQSAVVWCILNRVDSGYWGNTIRGVVIAKNQFHGYSSYLPVEDEIRELVEDVLYRWNMEKMGVTNVGRTLPDRFMYFIADGTGLNNVFTTYDSGRGEVWDFNCWNPYE